jgi:hypothetical protein
VFDAIQPGTYNVTVQSRGAGGDCCKPGGSVKKTIKVETPDPAELTTTTDPLSAQVAPQKPSPNPVVVGMFMFVGLVTIGIAFMDTGGDE